jgi:hypothetical protein
MLSRKKIFNGVIMEVAFVGLFIALLYGINMVLLR